MLCNSLDRSNHNGKYLLEFNRHNVRVIPRHHVHSAEYLGNDNLDQCFVSGISRDHDRQIIGYTYPTPNCKSFFVFRLVDYPAIILENDFTLPIFYFEQKWY